MGKRAVIIPLLIIGVATALLFTIKGCWSSWNGGSAVQRTDDAYIRADLTPLSTRISGTVRRIDVDDFEPVTPGQVLVELNDTDYSAILAEAKAGLAAAQAGFDTNQAAKRIQEAQVENAMAGVTAAAAAIRAAEAGVDVVQPDVDRVQSELRRARALFQSKATTHQKLEQATAEADRFSALLAASKAQLSRAEAALSSSQALLNAAKREQEALNTKDELYRADMEAKRAAITVAEVNLSYTRILAPTVGAVGERHIQVGQLVSPGMEVIALVKGDVWVQANYKETQLTNVRKGDSAEVRIDAFPGTVLHGKVAEISPASGSQFALLPPDNATGNFTKVVQRIPVKIVLDPGHPLQGRLRPGFSTEVTIHASGRDAGSGGQQP